MKEVFIGLAGLTFMSSAASADSILGTDGNKLYHTQLELKRKYPNGKQTGSTFNGFGKSAQSGDPASGRKKSADKK